MSVGIQWLLGGLLLGWATVVAVVSGVAIARWRARRREPVGRARWWARRREPLGGAREPARPRVVVLRPCAGLEPHLRRSLESTASLRYGGPLRVVLGTSTAQDPACPVLRQVAASLRAQGLDVTVGVFGARGANLKASQLAGMLDGMQDGAEDDVALVIDSDVELEDLDLDRMLAPLRDPSAPTGAVWCPPVERQIHGLGDRMSAALLGGSLHAFTLLGALDPHGLVGKTFAIRIDALRAIGGFDGLVQHLGEDMEIARRLREKGWQTAMSPAVVTSLACRRCIRQVLGRYARWLMVIRAQRPALLASYPLLLAATPGLLVASSIGLAFDLPGAGLALGLALAARLAIGVVASAAARRSLHPAAVLIDALLADGLLLAAFGRAAFGPAIVQWRGRSLQLGARGRLEVVEAGTR